MFLGLPHGASQDVVPDLVGRVGAVVDLAADFRLADAGLYPRGTARSTPAPSCSATFAYGLPELFRDDIAGAGRVAAPAATRRPRSWPWPPAAGGLVEPQGIVVDAASGVSGAGRGPRPATAFCTVDENLTAYGLLDHRHTPEIEQGLSRVAGTGSGAVHAPPGAHEPGHPGHLLRPPDRARSPPPPCSTSCARRGRRAVRGGDRRPPATKATLGANTVHVTAMADARTGWVVAIAALDNLVKGASGPGGPVRQPGARPARDRRPPDRGVYP